VASTIQIITVHKIHNSICTSRESLSVRVFNFPLSYLWHLAAKHNWRDVSATADQCAVCTRRCQLLDVVFSRLIDRFQREYSRGKVIFAQRRRVSVGRMLTWHAETLQTHSTSTGNGLLAWSRIQRAALEICAQTNKHKGHAISSQSPASSLDAWCSVFCDKFCYFLCNSISNINNHHS